MNGALTIRVCRRDDLRALEWDGLFSHNREIFERTFRQQLAGEQLMLLAEFEGAPVAQAWIDLRKGAVRRAGTIWGVRVHPRMQGDGVGTRLMRAAEESIVEHGLAAAEVAVERSNLAAHAFYERLGYRVTQPVEETYSYTTPEGEYCEHHLDLLEMRKELT